MLVLPDQLLSKQLPKQALELQAYLFTSYIAVTPDYICVKSRSSLECEVGVRCGGGLTTAV